MRRLVKVAPSRGDNVAVHRMSDPPIPKLARVSFRLTRPPFVTQRLTIYGLAVLDQWSSSTPDWRGILSVLDSDRAMGCVPHRNARAILRNTHAGPMFSLASGHDFRRDDGFTDPWPIR